MEAALIAILSGFLGGLGGVGYKVSNLGKVSTLQTAAVIAFPLAAALLFIVPPSKTIFTDYNTSDVR